MNIDEIAQRIVSSFNAGDKVSLKQWTKLMLLKIRKEESMFSVVRNPYLVAKSLYFMLTEDCLSEDDQMSAVKLSYFCLLKNFLKNMDKRQGDSEYEDLVSGCKLALVLISMQNQYLMYSIIMGQANYINPDQHIRNQLFVFGGIAKEANLTHCDFPLEDVINRYFVDIFKELYSNLPTGSSLALIKEKAIPVINSVENGISAHLKENWFDDI